MPWFQHRDGAGVRSGTISFGLGYERSEIRAEDGVFWAPNGVADTVEAAGHTRLDHDADPDSPPPVQDTASPPEDTTGQEEDQGETSTAENGSEPTSEDAPTLDEIQAANRNTAWSLVKEADPEQHLGLEYAGENAAGADEMRRALLEHYDYEDDEE